mgnify:CR=1 FL=1
MSADYNVLIVDDVSDNIKVAMNILKENNYNFSFALNGKQALEIIKTKSFDIVLLDIMMPHMNGFEVCEYLKKDPQTQDIPVIFLTAKADLDSLAKGFKVGAVDYITKPFSMPILLRKIAAVLRRSKRGEDEKPQIITYGNLLLNCDSYAATVDGSDFELTQKEFEILRELLTHQGRILTRQNLLDKLWRYDFYGDERVVDTHIKNLRKKLGIDFIQTIRGVGYKVDKEN